MIDEKWRTSDYLIIREPDGVHCYIALDDTSTALLPHRVRHSPDGFEYGYSGSGPSDLARSIVAHFYAVTDADLDTGWWREKYQQLRDKVIASLD